MIRKLFKIFASGLMVFSGASPVLAEPSASPETDTQTVTVDSETPVVSTGDDTSVPAESASATESTETIQENLETTDYSNKLSLTLFQGGSIDVTFRNETTTLSVEEGDFVHQDFSGETGETLTITPSADITDNVIYNYRNADGTSDVVTQDASQSFEAKIGEIKEMNIYFKGNTGEADSETPKVMMARISPRAAGSDTELYRSQVAELLTSGTGAVIPGTRVITPNTDIMANTFLISGITGGPLQNFTDYIVGTTAICADPGYPGVTGLSAEYY